MKKDKKIKSKKQLIYDNKKQLNFLVSKIYDNILKLDTETLHTHSFEVYKELISRDDFNSLDDEITKFQILCDDLKEKGVDITCLM